MNYLETISSAITALRSNLLRTGLTMLGIVIGIASVIIIVSLGQGASSSITSQVSSLGGNLVFISPGSPNQEFSMAGGNVKTLTYDDAKFLEENSAVLGLSAVSSSANGQMQVVADGENANVSIHGVSEGYQVVQTIEISQGRFITADDENALARVAVLGPETAKNLFGEGTDPIGNTITIDSRSFKVIGVTKAKGTSGFTNPDKAVFVPVTTAMKVLLGQDYVQAIYVTVTDPALVDQTMKTLTDLLLDRHKISAGADADFSVNSSQQALSIINTVTSTLVLMLAGIAGISLLVGGIGIMNIMLVTVTERTKEIGLLKAIGAKRRDILGQFLIESSVLTILGGVIGIVLGIIAAYFLAQLIGVPFVVKTYSILLAVGVSTVVGVLFGWYPARRAAKLNPIEALRYE